MGVGGMRAGALAASLLAGLALGLPRPASGEGGAKSRITIEKLSSTGVAGKVRSSRASCLSDRKVSLFVLEDFVTDKLEVTWTSSSGKWRIRRALEEGVYFAKVDAGKGCRYDNSRRKRLTI